MTQQDEQWRRVTQHPTWSNESRTGGSHGVAAPTGARPVIPSEIYNAVMREGGQSWTGPTLICSPPCGCLECEQQYRCQEEQMTQSFYVYAGSYEDVEAASIAEAFSSTITQNLSAVRTILECHGQLIHKRWAKKTSTRRKTLLLQAYPDMYPHQHTLIQVVADVVGPIPGRKYRKALLLPYVNQEGLSRDSTKVLQLLHYRTVHDPAEWVAFDNKQLFPAWKYGALEEKFVNGCVVLHGKEYGKWKTFNQTEVHTGRSCGTPRALLILETQADLSMFLLNFVKQLLLDVNLAQLSKPGPEQGY